MPPDDDAPYHYTAGLVEEILLGATSDDLEVVEYQVDCQRAWAWYQTQCPQITPLVQAAIQGYSPDEIARWQGLSVKLVLAALLGAYREMATWLNR